MQIDEAATRRRVGLFEPPSRAWPRAVYATFIVTEHPGRADVQVTERLDKTQTQWRSATYVTARHSADGLAYAPGDPIPEAEAIRQGVYAPLAGDPRTPIKDRKLCPHCGGTGLRGRAKIASHPRDCRCPMCGPCKVCGGARYVVKEAADHG